MISLSNVLFKNIQSFLNRGLNVTVRFREYRKGLDSSVIALWTWVLIAITLKMLHSKSRLNRWIPIDDGFLNTVYFSFLSERLKRISSRKCTITIFFVIVPIFILMLLYLIGLVFSMLFAQSSKL